MDVDGVQVTPRRSLLLVVVLVDVWVYPPEVKETVGERVWELIGYEEEGDYKDAVSEAKSEASQEKV